MKKIRRCQNVRECLCWLDDRIPGFWNFATKKPLSPEEYRRVTETINRKWLLFTKMYLRINQLKETPHWSTEDTCYNSLLKGAFEPTTTQRDLSKIITGRRRL